MREIRTSSSMSGVEETGPRKASVSVWAKAHPRSRLRPSFRYRASRRLSIQNGGFLPIEKIREKFKAAHASTGKTLVRTRL